MKSLEHRLQIGLSLSLLVLFVMLWFLGQKSMNDLTHEFVGSRLEHDIESLLAVLKVQSNTLQLDSNRMTLIYNQPFSGHYYAIALNNLPVIASRSLWDESLEIPILKIGEKRLEVREGPDKQKLLVISMSFNKKGQHITITLAEDLSAIEIQQNIFKKYFFIASLLGLVLLFITQNIILRFSFKRLESIRSDIKRLEEGDILNLSEDVPAEILPLVQEVNHLLKLLEQRLERSRNALGNLSHALKSPLNLLFQYFNRQESDTIYSLNNSENSIDANQQVERLDQLINRELKRARLAGKGGSTKRFNAAKELPDLVNVVEKIYLQRQLEIEVFIGSSITTFGDREDMLELIGNLLDNASKWADKIISLKINAIAVDQIHIIIEDDGAGIEEQQLASLLKRGERLDEAVTGHGLGLSIVNDIVKLYGGSIEFSRSELLGGLCVSIKIDSN